MSHASNPHGLPPLSCDAHTHVFGPPSRFPFVNAGNYEPPDSRFELHTATMRAAGIDRAVAVQPAVYGADNSALCDALQRSEGRLRGIGVATGGITDAELKAMDAAGVRGLRFTEMVNPNGQGRYQGAVGVEELAALAPRMCDLGWHAQVWADIATCVRLADELSPLGLPLVFDHLAQLDVEAGLDSPLFQALLRALDTGDIWVKLSVVRVSKAFPDYGDVQPFHKALLRANPERLVWASDYPFVRLGDRTPTVGKLVETFLDWTPQDAMRRRILVDNPARLYGFSEA